ncbi:MAG: 4-hydroxy-3-methylbut-2-enyl diphosphate reductase [Treponema sp.]|nr:4-hydroxy-3-methylbut-2-enyl diphosphate reductase [Treponema sp.]
MEVIRAEVMGFCMGVRRAVETAEKVASEHRESPCPIFTLGPLIHNPAVMDSLREKGVDVVDGENLSAVKNGSPVVIRAHGAAPKVVDSLKKMGALVVDATCPRVRQSQKRVMDWSRLGYSVVVAGDKNHGEVTGLSGYFDPSFGGDFTVVQTVDEAKKLVLPEKTMLIAQTTFSLEKYSEIRTVLSEKNPSIKIFDSICPATMERQKSLAALEGKSDGILVVGGKNSANTRRLLESAEKICPRTALIEGPEEIPEDFFAMEKVALTAGASTPDWIIDRVENRLKSRN